jgi:predicted transcriptional regulator
MALFLETVNTATSAKYAGLTLNECLCEGIQLTQEMMDLQEAVFRADFILSEKNQDLSESVQALNEAGFLSSVWEKVKNMLKKVWEWIKATWNKLVAKLKEWANRIGDRLSGNTKEIKKSTIKKAELMESTLTSILGKCTSAVDKISGNPEIETVSNLKEEINSMMESYNEDVKEAEKLEGRVTVSATFAKKITGTADRLQKDITKAINSLEKAGKAVDKELTEMKTNNGKRATFAAAGGKGEFNKSNASDIDRTENNEIVTGNAKIAFIRTITAILKNATTNSANTASSVMTAFSNKNTVNDIGKNAVRTNTPKWQDE